MTVVRAAPALVCRCSTACAAALGARLQDRAVEVARAAAIDLAAVSGRRRRSCPRRLPRSTFRSRAACGFR